MNNPFSLTGKTILITGASSGIGRGISIACAGMGARVVLTARSMVRLQETRQMIAEFVHEQENLLEPLVIQADLTNEDERQRLVADIPLLDGLVQCAGVMNRVPGKLVEKQDIDSVFCPNVEAPMLLQSELLRERKINKNASIVYMASIAARLATAGNALYSASKAAIISYAKCLALELAPRAIRVNCISPAMVWTDMAQIGATQAELEKDQLQYPLKRYGTPNDIANLAIYLLSDASCWMTGTCVEITGGV